MATRKMNKEQEAWANGKAPDGTANGLVVETQINTYVKAMTTRSPVSAIKAMCHACNAYEDAYTRTRECDIKTCPLWVYRHGNSEWPKRPPSNPNGFAPLPIGSNQTQNGRG